MVIILLLFRSRDMFCKNKVVNFPCFIFLFFLLKSSIQFSLLTDFNLYPFSDQNVCIRGEKTINEEKAALQWDWQLSPLTYYTLYSRLMLFWIFSDLTWKVRGLTLEDKPCVVLPSYCMYFEWMVHVFIHNSYPLLLPSIFWAAQTQHFYPMDCLHMCTATTG